MYEALRQAGLLLLPVAPKLGATVLTTLRCASNGKQLSLADNNLVPPFGIRDGRKLYPVDSAAPPPIPKLDLETAAKIVPLESPNSAPAAASR